MLKTCLQLGNTQKNNIGIHIEKKNFKLLDSNICKKGVSISLLYKNGLIINKKYSNLSRKILHFVRSSTMMLVWLSLPYYTGLGIQEYISYLIIINRACVFIM